MARVVVLGLATAGLCAVAGHQPWAHARGSNGTDASNAFSSGLTLGLDSGRAPGVTALSLVLLACWGVLLVTRGRVRRVVTWLALLVALGAAAAVVVGFGKVTGQVAASYAQFGITDVDVTRGVWGLLAFPLVLAAVAAALGAVRLVGSWPEMGRRYEAPGAPAAPTSVDVGDDQDDVLVWRALNEGRDPTA